MSETATGLILRTWPLTETSLIIHWLTREQGRVATAARGASRPKSPFRGKLDLFYLADFSFTRNPRSDLHSLREVSLRETHSPLRRELACLEQASYCAALIEHATETEAPIPAVFELMLGFLQHLPSAKPETHTVFSFELKLLRELGLEPDLEKTPLNPGDRQVMRALLASDWPALTRLRLSQAQEKGIRQFLHGFLNSSLGKVPQSRDAAVTNLTTEAR
jgi:DNA repair protein RecO (recombination protein O)